MLPLVGFVSSLFALGNIQIYTDRQCSSIIRLQATKDEGVPDMSRRQALLASVAAFGTLLPVQSYASEVRAPIECLLPATRVKRYITDVVNACNNVSTGKGLDARALEQFETLLYNPPVFIKENELKATKTYRSIKTQNAWNKARRTEREQRGAELGIDYATPYDKINTAIQEWGDQRQFRNLRKRQLQKDVENPMRAALNAYTNNLVFGDGYQLNAQDEEKKNLVRNNALPNVNLVVVSDLDLRDLIRNQILQNIDDARAELKYQLQQPTPDMQEILMYLEKAQTSCDEWFQKIPVQDVKVATNLVSSEDKLL
mmetsp:Transcript_59565/g.69610  ORF Transcript_59565/g.69610 Transcript_59565/m.69610 type:complete len:314 (-) Transcript_59565:304-1245(-)